MRAILGFYFFRRYPVFVRNASEEMLIGSGKFVYIETVVIIHIAPYGIYVEFFVVFWPNS